MNWKSFEEVVSYIYENIGVKSGLAIEGRGHKCLVKGKSGISHQIDILFSHSDGVHKYFTAIECKYWNGKINKEVIMKLQSICIDCNIDKGIIVSKYGFTKDTIEYAKYVNIGLVELREPNSVDPDFLKNRITFHLQTHINVSAYQIKRLVITGVRLNTIDQVYLDKFCSNLFAGTIEDKTAFLNALPEAKGNKKDVPIDEFDKVIVEMAYLQSKAEMAFIRLRDNSEKTLQDYIMKAVETKIYPSKNWEIVRYQEKFISSAIFWNKEDLFSTSITQIIIEGKKIEKKVIRESQIRNYALMVMKVIFENKKFILNEDGTVVEQDVD
jgi:hypothetical protein